MSSSHHIEIFASNCSIFHTSTDWDDLDENTQDKIFQAIATALAKEVSEIGSLVGTME